jgi:hypothetical protein
MNELLIFFLTANDRHFIFDKFKDELNKLKYKNKIKLLIVNSHNDDSFYHNSLKNSDINYDVAYIPCPQWTYIPKVQYAIQYAKNNNFKYILKYDNDVLMPSYTLNFIIENLHQLDDKTNLTIGPCMTTGIPTVECFINDFLNVEEASLVRNEFKKCIFNIQESIMDYTPLNKCTIDNNSNWDGDYYYDSLHSYMDSFPDMGNGRTYNNYCKFYRGIHPIRHGFGNDVLNSFIIKHKNKLFVDKPCFLEKDTKCKQLVAMCFAILTENYDRIINIENLTIDGCDEVPVNRFAWNNNLNHMIIRNGFAIHITYNWRWNLNAVDGGSNIDKSNLSLLQYEEKFIKELYNNDTN